MRAICHQPFKFCAICHHPRQGDLLDHSAGIFRQWGEALEQKDPGTWSHCQQVAAFATVLAEALDLEEEEIRAIACGALLHEIGKLEIPEAILRKPAALTAEEKVIMREYCLRGYEIVRKEPSLQDAAESERHFPHPDGRALLDDPYSPPRYQAGPPASRAFYER